MFPVFYSKPRLVFPGVEFNEETRRWLPSEHFSAAARLASADLPYPIALKERYFLPDPSHSGGGLLVIEQTDGVIVSWLLPDGSVRWTKRFFPSFYGKVAMAVDGWAAVFDRWVSPDGEMIYDPRLILSGGCPGPNRSILAPRGVLFEADGKQILVPHYWSAVHGELAPVFWGGEENDWLLLTEAESRTRRQFLVVDRYGDVRLELWIKELRVLPDGWWAVLDDKNNIHCGLLGEEIWAGSLNEIGIEELSLFDGIFEATAFPEGWILFLSGYGVQKDSDDLEKQDPAELREARMLVFRKGWRWPEVYEGLVPGWRWRRMGGLWVVSSTKDSLDSPAFLIPEGGTGKPVGFANIEMAWAWGDRVAVATFNYFGEAYVVFLPDRKDIRVASAFVEGDEERYVPAALMDESGVVLVTMDRRIIKIPKGDLSQATPYMFDDVTLSIVLQDDALVVRQMNGGQIRIPSIREKEGGEK